MLRARLVVERPPFRLDVELEVPPGTTVALLGPNGAGKSTMVDALAGLTPLDDGRITLGADVLDDPALDRFVPPEERRIGVVFQRYHLFDHLSVLDNVAFGPACRGRGRRRARAEAGSWLERLGLGPLAARRPATLSGGQAQQVALARALAAEPRALLLDEPLAALDVATRSRLRRTLASHLGDHAGPRLLITHDPTDAFLLADAICVVEDGRIVQRGSGAELRSHPATPYVAALAGRNVLAATVRAGSAELRDHPVTLHVADRRCDGAALVTIAPNAVALHAERPHGSPRNSWRTTITSVEATGEVTRIGLADPLPLVVDITPAATRALALGPGAAVWASVKATEITVDPA